MSRDRCALEPGGGEPSSLAVAPAEHVAAKISKRVTFLEQPVELAQQQEPGEPCDVCLSTFYVVDQYERPAACSRQHHRGLCVEEDEDLEEEEREMEKDPASGNPRPSACYRAYEGLKPANNGNTSSLKRSGQVAGPGGAHEHGPVKSQTSSQVRCLCFGGVPDKASRHSFLKGFLINLAICAILVLYTLLGSFIFLYIEGSTELPQQRILATTIPGGSAHGNARRNASLLNQVC